MNKGAVFYFSGTGNTEYVARKFAKEVEFNCYCIEENINFVEIIKQNEIITLCFPIHLSSAPIIFVDFVKKYNSYLNSKKLILFCTQQFFSGDGARSITEYIDNAKVIYAKHFRMPNNIVNIPYYSVLTKGNVNKSVIRVNKQIEEIINDIRKGVIKNQGFNKYSIKLGLGQREEFYKRYKIRDVKAKINDDCVLCNSCVKHCPTKRLKQQKGKIINTKHSYCTMCMRCVNICPSRAITVLFHNKPKYQYRCINFK